MVASATFAEFLREHLAPLGRVTMRRMFGKTGVFCDGVMFAVVTENTLYVRVDDQNRTTFKEAQSSRRSTTPKTARPSTSPSGASRSGCSMIPTSLWRGHGPLWRRRTGSRRSGNGRRQGENQSLGPNEGICDPVGPLNRRVARRNSF
jgi:hypothetical protein